MITKCAILTVVLRAKQQKISKGESCNETMPMAFRTSKIAYVYQSKSYRSNIDLCGESIFEKYFVHINKVYYG